MFPLLYSVQRTHFTGSSHVVRASTCTALLTPGRLYISSFCHFPFTHILPATLYFPIRVLFARFVFFPFLALHQTSPFIKDLLGFVLLARVVLCVLDCHFIFVLNVPQQGWANWQGKPFIQLNYPMVGDAKLSNCPPLVCLQEAEICGKHAVETM